MTTNYNKTDGLSPTTRKLTGHNSRKTQSPLSLRPPYPPTYTLPTIFFTNIILMADKHNIPKGKMHSNYRLLPDNLGCKITQRNNTRKVNTCDPALKPLNEEITSDIQKHKQNLCDGIFQHWDHRNNTHILWKNIHGISNRAPTHTLNTSITFNNKITTTSKHIANYFTKQFTNTVKHATHKTNRSINRATHKIQGYNITLTTTQGQEAIQKITTHLLSRRVGA